MIVSIDRYNLLDKKNLVSSVLDDPLQGSLYDGDLFSENLEGNMSNSGDDDEDDADASRDKNHKEEDDSPPIIHPALLGHRPKGNHADSGF